MFNRLFSKAKSTPNRIRETLFGDMPLDQWPTETSPPQFPWSAFVAARNRLAASDFTGAVEQWRQVLATHELEPRHYLQAWHFLRQYGQQPKPDEAKNLFGVVVELGMPKGLDLLAAYRDHSARYYNFSGGAVVWERPDTSLDPLIDALLSASAQTVARIGPWQKERPPAPPPGHIRLSFLTPSGLHFGEGPTSALASDALGGRVIQTATQLMRGLIAKTSKVA